MLGMVDGCHSLEKDHQDDGLTSLNGLVTLSLIQAVTEENDRTRWNTTVNQVRSGLYGRTRT